MSYAMGGERKENDSRDGIKPFREYGEIDKPVQRMVFADAYTEHRFLYGPYWPIEMRDGQLKFKPYDKFNGQYMSNWHSNSTNFAFADMHCEFYKYKSRKTILMIGKKSLGGEILRLPMGSQEQEQNLDPYYEVNMCSENNPDLDTMIQYLKGRKE
jgi:prepilin-type processing-associated H-X9-DG protein